MISFRPQPVPVFMSVLLTSLLAACGSGGGAGSSDEDSPVFFVNATSEAGLGDFKHVTGARGDVRFPETMGAGGGFLDYDGDGYPDIILVGGGTWEVNDDSSEVQAIWLFRNLGDGTFEDVTEAAGLARIRAYGMGVTAADYDADGDQDIFLTAVGSNLLLRNDDGVFVDATQEAGLASGPEWSTAAVFFDADLDGWLDLLVGNYVEWSLETEIPCYRQSGERAYCTPELYRGLPPRFYRNQGNGTFEDLTEEAGFAAAPGKTLGMVVLDYNNDGFPDVAFANDTEADQLYENQGGGRFRDVGLLAGLAYDEQGHARAGMGIDAGDVDGNGHISIFVGNFDSEMTSMFTTSGDGLFADRSASSGIGAASLPFLTFGVVLLDVDLDGDLDLLTANGHIDSDVEHFRDNATHAQRVNFFLNDGNGRFTDGASQPAHSDAVATRLVGRGAAIADVDLDGDQDILLTENGGGAYLWLNNARSDADDAPSFLRLTLIGSGGNPDAIGTTVRIVSESRTQVQQVRAGNSYLSVSEKPLTFGLGVDAMVDTIEVTWPDGSIDVLTDTPVNQMLIVEQSPDQAP